MGLTAGLAAVISGRIWAAFGLDGTPEDITGQKEPYGIHADVADVFELFLECQGSWRIGLMGGLQGLVKSDVIRLPVPWT